MCISGSSHTAPARPNPRTISNTLHAQAGSVPNDRRLTDWAFQWGQWITHDLDLTSVGLAELDRRLAQEQAH